jgi:multiple sugar transport system substrate-binding protein
MAHGEGGMSGSTFSRRNFLRMAGLAAAGTAVGCRPKAPGTGASPAAGGKVGGQLRIIQWSHFVPAYDEWFDKEYTKQWGDKNNVEVIVDHIPFADLPGNATAEIQKQSGHDLHWFLSPRPAFEDQVLDHKEIVQEVEGKVGKMLELVDRSVYNPRTRKYFGFSDTWSPDPLHWRKDLWEQADPGHTPDTWDDILRAGPKLKQMGHPLGIGLSQDIDANMALMSLLHSFGAYLQDEDAAVTINSKETVEAVKFASELYRTGMTKDVLSWDARSNNEYLLAGTGSLILNAVSALRTIEKQKPELAANISLAKMPKGPVQRLGLEHVMGVYVIWKFAKNAEAAKKFLVDLAVEYRQAFVKSESYNFPSFPGAVKDLDALIAKDAVSKPADKLAVLTDAASWSTNVGHPGNTNAAIDEVFYKYLIPQMFAEAATGKSKPEESVRSAETQMKAIFDKWRNLKKI